MNTRSRLILAALALLVGAALLVAGLVPGGLRLRPRRPRPSAPPMPACAPGPLFIVPPVPPERLAALVPLGRVVPSAHVFPTTQLNLYLAREDGRVPEVPLLAPGPLRVTRIARKEQISDGRVVVRDYSLSFEACREVDGRFMLVHSLDPALERAVGDWDDADCERYSTGGARFSYCSVYVAVDVAAGQPLGTVGNPDAGPAEHGADLFDWGVRDHRRPPTPRANPARLAGDPAEAFVACPIDLYPEGPVRDALLERAGSTDGRRRTVEPRCGTVDVDRPGTAAGRWYAPGEPERPEDPHFALVRDETEPARGVLSVGRSFEPLLSAQRVVVEIGAPDSATNPPFERVDAAHPAACYQALLREGQTPIAGVVRLRLDSPTRLSVTVDSGARDCADPEGPAATRRTVTFER